MANEVLEVGEDPRIQIFIASQSDAVVTITSPIVGTYTVFVAANTVHVETMHPMHVVNLSERTFQRAVFLESDVPVVVYALNTLAQSSDSYTAIPIKHCGKLYYTVNRPTDWYRSSNTPTSRIPRVGEFMVMATENNTLVDIVTTTATKGGVPARTPWRVWLNKGDCYLVQAAPTRFGGDDLTGSSVTSNIPVAVLSGHVRASMPLDSLSSKDHLVEQLPSVNLWGKTYATTPFITGSRKDVIRIMGSSLDQDVVLITKSGGRTFRLTNPGDWRDTSLSEPAYWSSTKPFFVTQFMTSTSGSNLYTDPAMVVVPAVEQFVNSALFQFPVLEISGYPNQQFYYFVNVIADSSALSTLRLDTSLVATIAPQIKVQKVPGTSLRWATLQLQQGAYVLSADTGFFSGVMYGVSIVDSYANMIGVAYEPRRTNDLSPPKFALLVDCGSVGGNVFDVSPDSARLVDIQVINARTKNYRWQISAPTDTIGSVEFSASIRDMWKDAQLVVHAYDNQGNGREWLYTYDAPNVDVPKEAVINLVGMVQTCTTAVIRNRDSTPVHIVNLSTTGDKRVSLAAGQRTDTILAPGDSLAIRVCITPSSDTSAAIGFLVIEYPCKLLRMMTVKAKTLASLRTSSLDLAKVRVGDTACGRVKIFNDGTVNITLTALAIAELNLGFFVDLASLRLPRILAPNDTLWVSVCFSPDSIGPFVRTDTVRSLPALGATISYRGTGVRPRLRSVVVDWGRRRVGTVYDTTVVLRNVGDGWCTASIAPGSNIDPAFTVQGPIIAGSTLEASDSVVVSLRYLPVSRGISALDVPVIIDWSRHEPVSISLRGVGMLPDVTVRDIDLGDVIVNTDRDSVVNLVETGRNSGNEPLLVRAVRVGGADASAFAVPASLTSLQSLGAVDSVRDMVRFTPKRLGAHICVIEIDHDAAPGSATKTSIFRIMGNGIFPSKGDLTLKLDLATSVAACTDIPVRIVIDNSGNGPMSVDTLLLQGAGQSIDLLPGGKAFLIEAFSSWVKDTVLRFDRRSATDVWVRLVDGTGGVLQATASTQVVVPPTNVTIAIGTPQPYVAGPTKLQVHAELASLQNEWVQPIKGLVLRAPDSASWRLDDRSRPRRGFSVEGSNSVFALRANQPNPMFWWLRCSSF
ncbi:MAG: IgGFc-binding protein [Candidatus Kapabacteria bacterium]|nr:IgGFc-binding protein [Candidatus Kapabacteria bacterium]